MSRHANLPFHLYVNVNNEFLGPEMPSGSTPGIWHAVHCRPTQEIMCHILLESGAHWSGMPLHAISTSSDFSKDRQILMPWACMGEVTEVFHAKYMEGLPIEIFGDYPDKGRHTGLIIDWSDGFSRYPQEHKPLSLIQLHSGQFSLLPNNYFTVFDKHFTTEEAKVNLPRYRRGEKVYWE